MRGAIRLGCAAVVVSAAACAQLRVDFEKQIRPVFEKRCLPCHDAEKPAGNLRMTTMANLLKGGTLGPAVVPVKPEQSLLMKLVDQPVNTPRAMPPDGPLPKAERDLIREWITIGAPWPRSTPVIGSTAAPARDEMAVVRGIWKKITEGAQTVGFLPYKQAIPGSTVSYEMAPIAAGEFSMGTPETEVKRSKDEGPQHKVKLDAFWMQKHEVTWDEYRLFMFAQQADAGLKDPVVDAISRPTRPYVEMSFGMGINGYPAISMTHHAANKYAQWLSAKTGHFYRLPTEAEWEYACRAGTTTAYSYGDDPKALGEYAWIASNSDGKYQKVGTKKPNPWGLYDMHGNVVEWVLDQYAPYKAGDESNPWVRATKPYPHGARGGSWNDDAARCRCGARLGSDPSWKMQDPQLPKSIWYHTDAQWLGFRLVRPVKIPSAEEMFKYWNSGVEQEE